MRIQNGTLLTMEGPAIPRGYVDFENGIITGCGSMDEAPAYYGPVLDANGFADMDASRRVVFKFRLTDEQMIQQLKRILENDGAGGQ